MLIMRGCNFLVNLFLKILCIVQTQSLLRRIIFYIILEILSLMDKSKKTIIISF